MSDNLRILGKYSAAMEAGDTDAVFEFWSDDFVSHVTERVSPEFLVASAETVAEAGYRGLQQGKRVIIPGALNKVMVTIMRFLPRRILMSSVGGYNRKRAES